MTIKGVPFICILGMPKIGKSRLAATFPEPYMIDTELGGGSAILDPNRRKVIPPSNKTLDLTRTLVQRMGGLPYKDKRILMTLKDTGEVLPIGVLIVDTIDGIQDPLKYALISSRPQQTLSTPTGDILIPGTMRDRDWGTLLTAIEPLILELRALPIPTILVAHTKTTEPFEGDLGSRGLSVQGALKDKMPRWFDLIAHLVPGTDNTHRIAVVQPKVVNKYAITAGDRHNIFGGKDEIKIPVKDGYPTGEFATKVLSAFEY